MHEVKSSNVRKIGYCKESSTLRIQFLGEVEYDYVGVPEAVFEDLKKSPSVGQFVHQNIKNMFGYKRVEKKANEENQSVKE
jgi:hypothetical protein